MFIAPAPYLLKNPVKAAAAAVVVNNIALVGSATVQATTITLTAAGASNFIGLIATTNGGTGLAAVSDNSGNTAAWQKRSGGTGSNLDFWYTTGGPLTGATITTTGTGGGFTELVVFAFSGVNATPFDGSAVTSNGAALSLTTTHPACALFSAFRDSGQAGPAAGWTQIQASAGFTIVQYKLVTATQSALSVADPAGTANSGLGDGLVST